MTLTLGKTFIHRERKEEVESRTTLNQLKNDTYSSQTLMLHTRLKESGFANSTSLIHEKPTQPQHRPSSSLRRFQIRSLAQGDAISISQLLTELAATTQKTPLIRGWVSNDPFHVNYQM